MVSVAQRLRLGNRSERIEAPLMGLRYYLDSRIPAVNGWAKEKKSPQLQSENAANLFELRAHSEMPRKIGNLRCLHVKSSA